MSIKRLFMGAVLLAWLALRAGAQDAVKVSADLRTEGNLRLLDVHLGIPDGFYLYADQFAVLVDAPAALKPHKMPETKEKHDPYTDSVVQVFDHDVTLAYALTPAETVNLNVAVKFQACNAAVCFLPATRNVEARQRGDAGSVSAVVPAAKPEATRAALRDFRVGGSTSGYLKASALLAFLDQAERGKTDSPASALDTFNRRGVWLSCLLIVLGGLALNLTPCVLPMIPVNLAIIGAGAQASSRARGLLLGGAYGVGIALVYGILGVVVVLTGARFGTLNASPIFNLGIALLFAVLALAMFDVIQIDLSRFQSGIGGGGGGGGRVLTALFFGGIAALLAGACVAPAVIGVLVLATDMYARGNSAGLLLPFLLGVGMGLPWPLAGAGLAVLPKPGRWMGRVKAVFGTVILLVALWYGKLAVTQWRERAQARIEPAESAQPAGDAWLTSLDSALELARREGKPVFIDFWASWCKNCLHMDKTTFRDEAVRARLADFVCVKYRAEDPGEPATKAILEQYAVLGLPTYVVLLPGAAKP